MTRKTEATNHSAYRERLSTPFWWYAIAIGTTALFASWFHLPALEASYLVPMALLMPVAAACVWLMGRSELVIADGEIRIRGAHLPLAAVADAVPLDERALRRLVGRDSDPAAFVQIRPWIGPGVQILLDDPDDPTPYWIVSTRNPTRVVELLTRR